MRVTQCLHINDTCIPKKYMQEDNICCLLVWGFFLVLWVFLFFKKKKLGSLRVAHMVINSALYSSSQILENKYHNYTTKQP